MSDDGYSNAAPTTPVPGKQKFGLKSVLALIIVGFPACCLCWCATSAAISTSQNVAMKCSGGKIIKALEMYRSDYGRYPDGLAGLTPRHLSRIPSPHWGDSGWMYDVNEAGDAFDLSVGYGGPDYAYPVWWYDSRHKSWHLDN